MTYKYSITIFTPNEETDLIEYLTGVHNLLHNELEYDCLVYINIQNKREIYIKYNNRKLFETLRENGYL